MRVGFNLKIFLKKSWNNWKDLCFWTIVISYSIIENNLRRGKTKIKFLVLFINNLRVEKMKILYWLFMRYWQCFPLFLLYIILINIGKISPKKHNFVKYNDDTQIHWESKL